MAWLTVEYFMEKSWLGIKLLMLGMSELWGEERSKMRRFLPEYLRTATPMGLILYKGKGGLSKGPIMNLSSTSLARRESTASGSLMAD